MQDADTGVTQGRRTEEFLHEPGLADARFARDEDELPGPLGGEPETLVEPCQLRLAADEHRSDHVAGRSGGRRRGIGAGRTPGLVPEVADLGNEPKAARVNRFDDPW